MIETANIEVGSCPSPGKRKAIEYYRPRAIEYNEVDETHLEITIYGFKDGRTISDLVITLLGCPEGQTCYCDYISSLFWQADSNCNAEFSWAWPSDGGCLQKKGQLSGSKSGLISIEQLLGDPGWPIYPIGDSRNPDCPGCGMAGAERETQWNVPVPGEYFGLVGCYDEEGCLSIYGPEGCKGLGGKHYETTGFCGGVISEILDEDKRKYEVSVKGETGVAYGVDFTVYGVGEFVALLKLGCEFPTDGEGNLVPVTSSNVCKKNVDEYLILPFGFQGE